jgi:predicted NUDIX family NTP pyrophosphohydrolase
MIGPGPRTAATEAARPTRWLVTGAAAAGPSLLGSVVGVPVRTVPSGAFVCAALRIAMPKLSAGLLLYRRTNGELEVLVAHPGGPIWARRDNGAWSIPKGALLPDEPPLDAARREFEEETGHRPPAGEAIDLGEVRMRSGKTVHGFALEGDLDPRAIHSMRVEIEWPPRSGQRMHVPEIDRVLWARPAEARQRLNPAQAEFVSRLVDRLDASHSP